MDVSSCCVILIEESKPLDCAYFCKVFLGIHTSQRASRTVFLATVGASLRARRIHRYAVAAEVALHRQEVLGRIDRRRIKPGTRCAPEPAWLGQPVDIMIPAAIGNAIRADNQARIGCRLLVEAANNPLTAEAETQLEQREITILPDFVANAAAAFLFCGLLERRLEPNLDSIFTVTSRQLRGITRELLERARRERVSNRRAAEEIAEARLRARQAYR